MQNAGYARDVGSTLGQEDSLEEGMATRSSILPGKSMDRGACWTTVYGVAESDMTEGLSTQSCVSFQTIFPAY